MRRSSAKSGAGGKLVALGLALSLNLTAIVGSFGSGGIAVADDDDLLQYVNPFIGSQDEGNTYPGAAMPFGMVQLSPDNGHNLGYNYTNSRIRGFSQVHLSGAGCGIGGFLPILPAYDWPTNTDYATNSYSAAYSHDNETAEPAYYQVQLDSSGKKINSELTATDRTGVQRYTFADDGTATVRINAGQALSSVRDSKVTVVDDQTVEAEMTVHGFCQDTNNFKVYTVTKFDQPMTDYRTWVENEIGSGTTVESTRRTGAALRFGGDNAAGTTVEAQTAISYVSTAGAYANLEAEKTDFEAAKVAGQTTWNNWLHRIEVSGGDSNQLVPFYSAWYRTGLGPNIGSDIDGNYRGWDGEVHNVSSETDDPDFTYYQNYSLWDTYRSQQQLLGLMEPERSADMMRSLVLQGEQYWAPRWGYGPVETNIMSGDPITPFLVTAWSQGLLDGDPELAERAYQMLKENVDVDNDDPTYTSLVVDQDQAPGADGRVGNPGYLDNGYIPYFPAWPHNPPGDPDTQQAGSATLEYALSDATLALMAKGLGHDDDAARYAERGQNFRYIFNTDLGSFQPRSVSGLFYPSDNAAVTPGFHEGTALQYEWMVPQDYQSLVSMFGGTEATVGRLDDFFAYEQLLEDPAGTARNVWVNGPYSYYNQDKYNPNNEPDLSSPYSYLWVGQPWKTTDVLRAALTLFTNGPTGVTGNDDLGQMSSWATLAAIGIYPIVPGMNVWGLSTPVFDQVKLHLPGEDDAGKTLTITADGVSEESHYAQTVSVGGENVDRAWLTGDELTNAGTIDYAVGSQPSSWATSEEALPPTISEANAPTRVAIPTTEVTLAGDNWAEVTLMVTAPGDVSGTVTLDSPAFKEAATGTWSTNPAGGTKQIVVAVPIELTNQVLNGTDTVNVQANVGESSSTAELQLSRVQDSVLTDSTNHKGIGKRATSNSGVSMDGVGSYYLSDALEAVGLIQGRTLSIPGTDLNYALPVADETVADQKDNVATSGTVNVPVGQSLAGATELSIIGAAPNGPQTLSVTLNYESGLTQRKNVALTDWCSKTPNQGDTIVGTAAHRGTPGGGSQEVSCSLSATSPIPLTSGKGDLTEIVIGGNANFHVFGIASDGSQQLLRPATAVEISGTVATGETLTASSVDWNIGDQQGNAKTTYQWYRDSVLIPGATAATYVVSEADLDSELTVAATGRQSGLLSGESRASIVAPNDEVTISRLSGEDRYATSVAIGERFMTEGKPLIVATGEGFADALSAAPAAASVDATLLLTRSKAIPQSVLKLIEQRKPSQIYLIGKTGAVSNSVQQQLAKFAKVERIGGDDRYQTSALIAAKFFPQASTAYVATGIDYPDALSASAAAAHEDAPMLLVNGKSASGLLSTTTKALQNSGVQSVKVVGESSAVNGRIQSDLQKNFTNVTRLGGADRYATAVKVNQIFDQPVESVWIASGLNFPDALTAAAVAGSRSEPVYLARPNCLDFLSARQIGASEHNERILVGGTSVLKDSIGTLNRCS